jgi:Flp pilus assembly protein TadD
MQCHVPAVFDTAEHHHHAPGTPGAQCVACHMPTNTYMGVHIRHDHSFRVPRPDLSATIGVPNACVQCHRDKSNGWAADALAAWFPAGRQATRHFGTALSAGRADMLEAGRQLASLAVDRDQPAIARGSALLALPPYLNQRTVATIRAASLDADPLVRAAVPRALSTAAPADAARIVAPLLSDGVRAVRVEAARALTGVDPQLLTASQNVAFARAYDELVEAEMVDADRPETHVNLGLLHTRAGALQSAEESYRTALRLDPKFVPALVNLADVERLRGREDEAASLLRTALSYEPDNADAQHALGLSLVRQKRLADALPMLRTAAEREPRNGQFAYVYAVALQSTGNTKTALDVLKNANALHPADRNILRALIAILQGSGNGESILVYTKQLLELDPDDRQIRALVTRLEKQQAP